MWNSRLRLSGSLCFLLMLAVPAGAQRPAATNGGPASETHVLLRQIVAELAAVREELRQLRAQSEEATIAALEAELNQVRTTRQRLDEQEQRDTTGELAELEEQLQQPNLDPQTLGRLSASRDALMAASPAGDSPDRTAMLERERFLLERLQREQRKRDRSIPPAVPRRQ